MDSPNHRQGQCYLLLPGHSLEDFPTHGTPAEAEDLLACWTACWHPAILVAQNAPSRWLRAGLDVPESSNSILLVPQIAARYIDESLRSACFANNTTLIQADSDSRSLRDNLINQALAHWPSAKVIAQAIDDDLIRDFFALAYAYLQVQLMTRQLRYSSNFKQQPFDDNLIRAAGAAAAGNCEEGQEYLTACFDLLMEERDCYYPVRPQLVDLVLLAKTTLGANLNRQLDSEHAMSLLLTGQIATLLAANNPLAIQRIQDLLDQQKIACIGGNFSELPDALVSSETVLRQLISGRRTLLEFAKIQPRVYCRHKYGLTPTLPIILESLDFLGAMHFSLDGGLLPAGSTVNIRWNGLDGSSIRAH
jgi:alpha-mannosidase